MVCIGGPTLLGAQLDQRRARDRDALRHRARPARANKVKAAAILAVCTAENQINQCMWWLDYSQKGRIPRDASRSVAQFAAAENANRGESHRQRQDDETARCRGLKRLDG